MTYLAGMREKLNQVFSTWPNQNRNSSLTDQLVVGAPIMANQISVGASGTAGPFLDTPCCGQEGTFST